MFVSFHNGVKVALLSSPYAIAQQAVRASGLQQRRWKSISSAIHAGLYGDASRFSRDRTGFRDRTGGSDRTGFKDRTAFRDRTGGRDGASSRAWTRRRNEDTSQPRNDRFDVRSLRARKEEDISHHTVDRRGGRPSRHQREGGSPRYTNDRNGGNPSRPQWEGDSRRHANDRNSSLSNFSRYNESDVEQQHITPTESARPRWQELEADLGFSSRAADSSYMSPNSQRDSHDYVAKQNTAGGSKYPLSVPYTTAASEFLYGYSAVYAALKAGRRKSYKLYLSPRASARDQEVKQRTASRKRGDMDAAVDEQTTVRKLAQAAKIKIMDGNLVDSRLLDKMSDGRPHNGIVLEASPLPLLSIKSLATPTIPKTSNTFPLILPDASIFPARYINPEPILLLLDDVLDPGNLGTILRSAYFLGIDAVVLTAHNAPLNAVALKAAAGAAEALQLFRTSDPAALLQKSRGAGWHVLGVTTPRREGAQPKLKAPTLKPFTIPTRNIRYHISHPTHVSEKAIDSRLSATPQLLVLGGEGKGLRKFFTDQCESFMEILAPVGRDKAAAAVGLDSLNVSAAAAVACAEVLRGVRVGVREGKASGEGEGVIGSEVAGNSKNGEGLLTFESDLDREGGEEEVGNIEGAGEVENERLPALESVLDHEVEEMVEEDEDEGKRTVAA